MSKTEPCWLDHLPIWFIYTLQLMCPKLNPYNFLPLLFNSPSPIFSILVNDIVIHLVTQRQWPWSQTAWVHILKPLVCLALCWAVLPIQRWVSLVPDLQGLWAWWGRQAEVQIAVVQFDQKYDRDCGIPEEAHNPVWEVMEIQRRMFLRGESRQGLDP